MQLVTTKAIIVAGGESRRMGGTDKIFAEIAGKPVIAHTLDAFERCEAINGIVLVLPKKSIDKGRELISKYGYDKVETICEGGATRQQSVNNGLRSTPKCDLVLVHDGARPCVTEETIRSGISEAIKEGVAIAASPVSDTIKEVDDSMLVSKTLDRSRLMSIHTPQVFRYEILKEVHSNPAFDATDDAALAENIGYKVKVYYDSYKNIKITTITDLTIAEAILSSKEKKA